MAVAFLSQQDPGTGTLVAGVASRRIVVDAILATIGGAAGTIVLNSASTPITPVFNLANGGSLSLDNPNPKVSGPITVAGEALTMTSAGGSSKASVMVIYHLIAG